MSETVQIIPYYAHPHVHVVINDNTFYDEATSTPREVTLPYSTCIVTGADSGIDNTFIRLQDLRTKRAIFGNGNYKKYGQASIQADVLFNGNTNVWFCRCLPDNATYANMIVMFNYRKGDVLDETGNPTGKKQLETKLTYAYAAKPFVTEGATKDYVIREVAETLASKTPDPVTGYMRLPLFYVRSIGRGKYGNRYAMKIERATDAEKEYDVKMYNFSLYSNENGITGIKNIFAGSLYQAVHDGASTLISDVLDGFATGSCPVSIVPFEDNFFNVFDFYKEIVAENMPAADAEEADVAEYAAAAAIEEKEFDPLFGIEFNSRTGDTIPYYKNYTAKAEGYVVPNNTIPVGGTLPLNISDWDTAKLGDSCLMLSDPNNGYLRWQYTVIDIDMTNGNIVYDEGKQAYADDDQYDGVDVTLEPGIPFSGGHDGDFQEVTVGGVTRAPSDAEMKLLLAREQVQVFKGYRDRKILSPARVDLDFIFDAGYNMTTSGTLALDDTIASMYNGSSVLTDADYRELSVLTSTGAALDFSDINVKQAMYNLNEFRNRNGQTIEPDHMAGCLLQLDCGMVGSKTINSNTELKAIFENVDGMIGRNTSVDLGYYTILDPYTGRKEDVTVGYFLAENLIPHLVRFGMNKPFVNNYAELRAIQRTGTMTTGDMVRDSFRPDIDLIDWDVKEALFKSRINYYITSEEGRVVQRACQNTRQLDASALLEENNVRVLNTLKKQLEKACRGYLYNWNEPEVRKGFTDAQMMIYRPWIGNIVQDINIRFEANEFEQGRMIMHCYVDVAFRDIIKRIILEININRPNY